MDDLIKKFYHNPFLSRFFHTLVYCLQKELKNYKSVLDLGCGSDSPIKYCRVRYSVGMDVFKPYLNESKRKKIHNKYILGDITKIEFEPESFDAVIMIEVLEHLGKKQGREILKKAEKWARKKVIVSTPNGYLPEKSIDGNPFQAHRSGWTVEEMQKLGYKARGMAGWEFLRRGNVSEKAGQEEGLLSTIKFYPKIFWLIVSELTQAMTYYFPKLAFEVFYVKNIK